MGRRLRYTARLHEDEENLQAWTPPLALSQCCLLVFVRARLLIWFCLYPPPSFDGAPSVYLAQYHGTLLPETTATEETDPLSQETDGQQKRHRKAGAILLLASFSSFLLNPP